MVHQAQFEQWVPASVREMFLFFANPLNLPRIMPPETGTQLLELKLVAPPPPPNQQAGADLKALAGAGSEIVTSFRMIPFLPFRRTWTANIKEFEWNNHFADVQTKGPFRRFQHRHEFFPETRNEVVGTKIRDSVEYEVGFGPLGDFAQSVFVGRQLQRTFKYRQAAVERIWLEMRTL